VTTHALFCFLFPYGFDGLYVVMTLEDETAIGGMVWVFAHAILVASCGPSDFQSLDKCYYVSRHETTLIAKTNVYITTA
jgi:hypothetical protein